MADKTKEELEAEKIAKAEAAKEAKKAEAEAKAAAKAEAEAKAEAAQYKEVYLQLDRNNTADYIGSVNGKTFKVKRGTIVSVPLDVYEVIRNSQVQDGAVALEINAGTSNYTAIKNIIG